MSFRRSVESIGKAVSAIANLGIEPKPAQRRLIEPMAWEEVHGFALREGYDRRHFISDDQGMICLLDTEANEAKITNKYTYLLAETGATPIVRKKTLKNGTQVIDLPLLVAERQIASSAELRTKIPKLYGEKPTEKGELDYLKMGLESQEVLADFALNRETDLHTQERLKNSETIGGRFRNIEEDVSNAVGQRISVTGQRLGSSVKTAIRETPRAARDTVQLGVLSFAIGEAMTESLVKPVINQALLDAKDTVTAAKDKVVSLPKTPADIISAVIINQLKKS